MHEVKTDALEASFEALEREDEDVAALRDEVAALKARVDAQAVVRPALSGAKSESSPFVERYLRKGLEHGVELKALVGTSDAAGGYAVPEGGSRSITNALLQCLGAYGGKLRLGALVTRVAGCAQPRRLESILRGGGGVGQGEDRTRADHLRDVALPDPPSHLAAARHPARRRRLRPSAAGCDI
mgnify:CR=1 FL=1